MVLGIRCCDQFGAHFRGSGAVDVLATWLDFLGRPACHAADREAAVAAIMDAHPDAIKGNAELLLSVLPVLATEQHLKIASRRYFPTGTGTALAADTFIPVGERWFLPALKQAFAQRPEAATPAVVAIICRFVALQVSLSHRAVTVL